MSGKKNPAPQSMTPPAATNEAVSDVLALAETDAYLQVTEPKIRELRI